MWKVEKEGNRQGLPQTKTEDGTWRLMALTVFEKHLAKDGKEGGNDLEAPFPMESQKCVRVCVCVVGGIFCDLVQVQAPSLFETPGLNPNFTPVIAAGLSMTQAAGSSLHGTVALGLLPYLPNPTTPCESPKPGRALEPELFSSPTSPSGTQLRTAGIRGTLGALACRREGWEKGSDAST